MKRKIQSLLVLTFLALAVSGATWVQEFHLVDKPTNLVNRPGPGWETNTVPSGTLWEYYAHEVWMDNVDGKRVLVWQRAFYYIPDQTFMVMRLMPDNTWLCVDLLEGPMIYHALNMVDGEEIVLRLQSL